MASTFVNLDNVAQDVPQSTSLGINRSGDDHGITFFLGRTLGDTITSVS